jgi:hypothetical protein
MSTCSADPAKLLRFVNAAKPARTSAESAASNAVAVHRRALAGCPSHGVEIDNLTQLDGLFATMAENETYVRATRAALMAADKSGNRILSAPHSVVQTAILNAGVAVVHPPLEFRPNVVRPGHPTGGYVDDPIAAATGNMLHDDVDLSFPGIGSALNLSRRYNSLLVDTTGAFGAGWSSMLDVRIETVDEQIQVWLADGAIATFVETDEGWGSFGSNEATMDHSSSGPTMSTR